MLLWNADKTEGNRFCVLDYHHLWFRFPADSAGDTFVTPNQRPEHPALISKLKNSNVKKQN